MNINKITLPNHDIEIDDYDVTLTVSTLARYLTTHQMRILMNMFSDRMLVWNYVSEDEYAVTTSFNGSMIQINNPVDGISSLIEELGV